MFMVFVAGKQTPRATHEYECDARGEAERLARLHDNIGSHVYVLELIAWCVCDLPPIKWKELK